MLKIQKETLTELTTEQLEEVVGGTLNAVGAVVRSCFAASCITGGEPSTTAVIRLDAATSAC